METRFSLRADMKIFTRINSVFSSCSYIIHGASGNIMVDCGDDSSEEKEASPIQHILLTHCHFDHIYGLNRVLERNPNALIYTNEEGRELLLNAKKNLSLFYEEAFECRYPDRIKTIHDGAVIEGYKAFFTPGHHPSCITWIIDDIIFSGDSYIPGIKTVTNLPGGNKMQAEDSVRRILAFGGTIYPGHPAAGTLK